LSVHTLTARHVTVAIVLVPPLPIYPYWQPNCGHPGSAASSQDWDIGSNSRPCPDSGSGYDAKAAALAQIRGRTRSPEHGGARPLFPSSERPRQHRQWRLGYWAQRDGEQREPKPDDNTNDRERGIIIPYRLEGFRGKRGHPASPVEALNRIAIGPDHVAGLLPGRRDSPAFHVGRANLTGGPSPQHQG